MSTGPEHRLDHVGIVVPSLDDAIEFFAEHLGARVEFLMDPFEDPTGAAPARLGAAHGRSFALGMLRLGNARLELLQWWPPHDAPASPADGVGGVHVAVEVADVPAALARLRAVPGVRVLGEPATFRGGQTPNLVNAFVTTPWGLLVELLTWLGPDETDV
ncbi:VOC family protein [Nocardioides marmoribigeumensis]|uniref:Catechol 2,3-dioxygenase-like lactoylglutathione lyase family enzyme n=1 Tax=Nocardioides marmoribigeumensis TaxID=433649 RepID=A0ABU2BUW4_9ACTN|nr:VOC family protein [Nocardioides marmoribigeumensis]MDR7362418.1 catechol 2,3-dioxygenase-like lactoylglutathione lyase family enzyme [Nocardioides marmoribigeumensis]